MGFAATLVYLALALISPWAAYPELAGLRIMAWLMATIAFLTLANVVLGRISLWTPQVPLLGVFLFLVMLSVAATGWLGGALIAFNDVTVPMVACIAVIGNVNSSSRIRWLSRTLVIVGAYLSVRVILALEFGMDLDTYGLVETVGVDESGGAAQIYRARALGFLADPNDLAQYLLACLPLAALLWRPGRALGNALQVVLPTCVMLGAMFLTRSRGGLIGLVLLVTLAASRISRFAAPIAGVAITAAALALGFSGGRATSISEGTGAGRIELWSEGLQALASSPLLGVGYKNIQDSLGGYTAHNSYVLCLVETGILGLYFWLAAFLVTYFQLWPVLSDTQVSPDSRRFCRAGALALASVMITGFFLSRTYALTPYIFLGVATSAFLVARKDQSEPLPVFRLSWLAWNGVAVLVLMVTVYSLVRLRWMFG